MAHASSRSKNIKMNSASGDFSLISGNADSVLRNASWPKQDAISFESVEQSRSAPADETCERNQILASHYALATAYQRVTKKLAEAEQRSQQLMMQDSLRGQENFRTARMSSSAGAQTNYAMPPDLEASVNEAWEAYNEKCKECQQLREELEEVRQRFNNTERHSRIQNLREDVLREKAKQDDVVRKLEKTKMEADHLEKKEILAREELEKEREYQKSIIVSAEKKHREMEQRIEELEINLTNEKSLTEDLRRREKDRQNTLQNEFSTKTEFFNSKIRELEERNISLKEEVAVLVSMQAIQCNGTASGNLLGANGETDLVQTIAHSSNFGEGKYDITLVRDLHLLRTELDCLKRKAAEQASMLQTLCQNTKFQLLLGNTNQIQLSRSEDPCASSSKLRSGPGSMPAQNSSELLLKRKKTSSPKTRNHRNLIYADGSPSSSGSSSMSPQDLRWSTTLNKELIASRWSIPPKKKGEYPNSQNTPVLKTTEEFIRGLSQEAATQSRRIVRPTPGRDNSEFNVIFPPMDVSRIIHTPESGDTHISSAFRTPAYSESATTPSSQRLSPVGNASANGPQSSRLLNGNVRPAMNERLQLSQNMQNSLLAMDDASGIFYSTMSSNSLSGSGANTLVLPPVGKAANMQPPNSIHENYDMPSVISAPGRSPTVKEIPHSSRRLEPTAAANFDTPAAARYTSSDEDNDSNSFERIELRGAGSHQPKEFVVPKVVRASDLVTPTTQSRKAFLDSGRDTEAAQTQPRPPIRARLEATGTKQGTSRSNRAGRSAEDAAATCPVCFFNYPAEWTEEGKRKHVNGHFSDNDTGTSAVD